MANIIRAGDKIELIRTNTEETGEKVVYKSQVYDVVGKEQLKIAMPQEKGRLQLLQLEAVYKIQFYTEGGLYEGKGKVVDRYKTDNVYVAVVDMISALEKIQRREFYRLNCLLDSYIHILSDEEIMTGDIRKILLMHDSSNPAYEYGIIVDISGGGARVVTDCEVGEGSYITLKFRTDMKEISKEYELLAKVVTRKKLENKSKKYELRIEFEQIENNVRETLIKYIFQEERKKRKSEKS